MDLLPVTIVVKPFDYRAVANVTSLRHAAERIRGMTKTTVSTIIAIGQELREAKKHLGHGQFSAWVEAECGFTVRTAENYIRASLFAEGKNETVSLLSPATIYKISAKSVPANIVDAVLAEAAEGRPPSDFAGAKLLSEANDQKRQERRKARRKPLTKSQIAYREKVRREDEELQARRRDHIQGCAATIFTELKTEKCRFLLDLLLTPNLAGFGVYEVLRKLRQQVDGGDA